MKILLSWINDYVDILDVPVADLSKKLASSGFEVEEIIDCGKDLKNVISAKIEKITKHPNADKLVVCKTQIGSDKYLQIVTGATNMKEGDKVALALDGANLPCGTSIKSGIIRGEKSEGMFCGGDELGINDTIYPGASVYGLLILDPSTPIGKPIAEILGLNETILDVNILPNRADCNSIYNMAREIAIILNRKLKPLQLNYKSTKATKFISVSVKNKKLCPRYMGCLIENVKNTPSPAWMQKRLTLLGHTPHSLYVDITNYCLLECGQPMHAFDVNKIENQRLIIRNAKNEERIIALDGKEYTLSSDNLVIADEKKPLVIAGIMGGLDCGTYPETKDVFLESACFYYANIRRSSYNLGLSSDSSIRYAKGVSIDSPEIALRRALNLIQSLNCGTITDCFIDEHNKLPKQTTIKSSVKRINDRLGLKINGDTMIDILNRLDIKSTRNGDTITSLVPLYRTDMERECDICEEVGRIYGLDNISCHNATPTDFLTCGKLLQEQENINTLRSACSYEGYNEMISWQFTSPQIIRDSGFDPNKNIQIANPIGYEYSVVRNSLIPAVLDAISYNQKQGNKNIYLFELANIFIPKQLPITELPDEKFSLCLATNSTNEDFYSFKNSITKVLSSIGIIPEYKTGNHPTMHPGLCADIMVYNKKVGALGKLHPNIKDNFNFQKDVYVAEIDLSSFLSRDTSKRIGSAPDKLPILEKDIALVVDKNTPAGLLVATAKKCYKQYVVDAKMFDIYEGSQLGENLKSVAITLFIKQGDKTLTDFEIANIMQKVINAEEKEHNAKLRK